MARQARRESATGIYHTIIRGINGQNIFEEQKDFERFKKCLSDVKEKGGIKLYSYCLLSNHVHLLIGAGTEPIGASLKRIGVRYASWYNRKYNRQGPLFQGRYKSEPIEDDSYLLAALRYIHQNPVKAGICAHAGEYKWSSYTEYIGAEDCLADTGLVLEMFSANKANQIKLFKEFSEKESDAGFADIGGTDYLSEESIRKMIFNICGAKNIGAFQALEPEERNRVIRALREEGVSIRQIVRMTGESFGIVRKIGK